MSVHHRVGQPPGMSSYHVVDAGGLGVLPEQVPTTGEHGASILANEAANVANAGKELRAVVTSLPTTNVTSCVVQSDGSVDLVVTADGTYQVGYSVYIDAVLGGTATATFTVGEGGSPGSSGEAPFVAIRRRRKHRGLFR